MKHYIGIAAAICLAACTSIDPYTGETKTSNTAKGAGIGAIAGAIIGGAVSSNGDREKGILTGALAGAAAGGGVGYYMDQQEAQMRAKLQGSGVQVQRDGDNLILVMPGNVTFASGRYEVKSDFYSVLNAVAEVLKEFQETNINVAGHTDSQGAADFNQQLSQKRANSVKAYLTSEGVAATRIQSVGYGESYPLDSNTTASGRERNRRVELTLVPIT